MQINQITVGWSETCSLPGYDNVKPSITLTATLTDDDKPVEYFTKLLMEQAQEYVRELINQAQELAGETPKYYTGPLYVIYKSLKRKVYLVVADQEEIQSTCFNDFSRANYKVGRKDTMLIMAGKLATNHGDGWRAFNCTDGDFSMLPPLPEPNPDTPNPDTPEDIPF